ncbi:MAG: hypothetical protein WC856_02375 [Methylococcaceae bacterium]|jgi:hypothetical protein
MTNGIKPKDRKLSSAIEAAIKNIELHMDFSDGKDNHLLTDFAIPQLKEGIARLRQ